MGCLHLLIYRTQSFLKKHGIIQHRRALAERQKRDADKHDPPRDLHNEIAQLADRIVRIEDGKIVG